VSKLGHLMVFMEPMLNQITDVVDSLLLPHLPKLVIGQYSQIAGMS
jgi:hypothetical protein